MGGCGEDSARFAEDFVDELRALADARDRLRPIIAALTRPPRVAVTGRPGVGIRTVTAALCGAGLDAVTGDGAADMVVLVIVEAVKPEDRQIYTDIGGPLLMVLNRADLLDEPAARAAAIGAATGVPTVPVAELPGDVDALLDGIAAACAPLRYRRLRTALTRLHTLAVSDHRLAELLAGDTAVLAAMAAAAEVVRAAGLPPDTGGLPRRAVRWQHYSRGPVNALHRDCGADLARGMVRLAARSGRLR